MKLSVVIICWNDSGVILQCLESIYRETSSLPYEIVVSDNGSTDGSVQAIRSLYPQVRVVENGANLGFARGNNAGIAVATGEYVLILNPDTIIHHRALEKLVRYADEHPSSGAFGCRVLNRDGSFQTPARPLPTPRGALIAALYMRSLGVFHDRLNSDLYYGWDGRTERPIGYQSGCCVLVRRQLLEGLGGFDERFFYHAEETDLCCRIWKSGSSIMFYPGAEITHLGGQSVGRFPARFALESYRSRYRYFYKHFGARGAARLRWINLINLIARWTGYGVRRTLKPSRTLDERLHLYRVLIAWNWRLNTVRFIAEGIEPDLGHAPMAPAPSMVD